MKISIVVAIAENNVIGKRNALPWYLPADLKHFKEITMGHHIIMGRKTHESIRKALPGRTNIVITRNPNYQSKDTYVVHSLENGISVAKRSDESEAFVIGGAEIFKWALPKADRIYLTKVKAKIDGDVYFPKFDEKEWNLLSRKSFKSDKKNKYPYEFLVLEKKRA